jgi:hypothetical protein
MTRDGFFTPGGGPVKPRALQKPSRGGIRLGPSRAAEFCGAGYAATEKLAYSCRGFAAGSRLAQICGGRRPGRCSCDRDSPWDWHFW